MFFDFELIKNGLFRLLFCFFNFYCEKVQFILVIDSDYCYVYVIDVLLLRIDLFLCLSFVFNTVFRMIVSDINILF